MPDVEALSYVYVAPNKIAYAVIADAKYPERVAFMILKKLSVEFKKDF